MPTYEFRCPKGHDFEKFYRTISGAESQAACPECGQPAERIMSATGFAFKGSGFYLTDYGKDAHRKKGPADAKADGAKSDAAGSSTASTSSGESGGGASSGAAAPAPKSEPKAAESKPAAAPKPSSSE